MPKDPANTKLTTTIKAKSTVAADRLVSGQAIFDARENYPSCTLVDMCDPDNDFLYPDLAAAHTALDAAVESAHNVDFKGNEEKIATHLFILCQQAIDGEHK